MFALPKKIETAGDSSIILSGAKVSIITAGEIVELCSDRRIKVLGSNEYDMVGAKSLQIMEGRHCEIPGFKRIEITVGVPNTTLEISYPRFKGSVVLSCGMSWEVVKETTFRLRQEGIAYDYDGMCFNLDGLKLPGWSVLQKGWNFEVTGPIGVLPAPVYEDTSEEVASLDMLSSRAGVLLSFMHHTGWRYKLASISVYAVRSGLSKVASDIPWMSEAVEEFKKRYPD